MKLQRRFALTSGRITPESAARLIGIRKESTYEYRLKQGTLPGKK